MPFVYCSAIGSREKLRQPCLSGVAHHGLPHSYRSCASSCGPVHTHFRCCCHSADFRQPSDLFHPVPCGPTATVCLRSDHCRRFRFAAHWMRPDNLPCDCRQSRCSGPSYAKRRLNRVWTFTGTRVLGPRAVLHCGGPIRHSLLVCPCPFVLFRRCQCRQCVSKRSCDDTRRFQRLCLGGNLPDRRYCHSVGSSPDFRLGEEYSRTQSGCWQLIFGLACYPIRTLPTASTKTVRIPPDIGAIQPPFRPLSICP